MASQSDAAKTAELVYVAPETIATGTLRTAGRLRWYAGARLTCPVRRGWAAPPLSVGAGPVLAGASGTHADTVRHPARVG
jgi:hypothetical protein